MVDYRCFQCNKTVNQDYVKKKVRCPYCGSKVIFKQRTATTKIKAR